MMYDRAAKRRIWDDDDVYESWTSRRSTATDRGRLHLARLLFNSDDCFRSRKKIFNVASIPGCSLCRCSVTQKARGFRLADHVCDDLGFAASSFNAVVELGDSVLGIVM